MKYYIIQEVVLFGTTVSKPLFATENEEIAKDICKRYSCLTYTEVDTKENKEND